MKKSWFYASQLVLFLAITTALAVGCENSPSTSTPGAVTAPSSKATSTPPPSEYPADISGRVTIAEHVQIKKRDTGETIMTTPKEGEIFWIVDISVSNKSYKNAIEANLLNWMLVVNDKGYSLQDIDRITVPVGEIGHTIMRLSVPRALNINDAKLCYRGEQPYSYGKLTGGEKVAVYDWDSKTAIAQSKEKEVKIDVTRIQRSNIDTWKLWVTFKPTSDIKANTPYVVRLYENGKFREEAKISGWNQPELNVKTEKQVYFGLNKQESAAYGFRDLSDIFSVKVFEAK